MNKIVILIFFTIVSIIPLECFSQRKGNTFSDDIEAANYIFGRLNPSYFDNVLLNRSFDKSPITIDQINGKYGHTFAPNDFLDVFSNISVASIDSKEVSNIQGITEDIMEFFKNQTDEDDLIQPFGLILNNVSFIDSLAGTTKFKNKEGQLVPYSENRSLYKKVLLKAAGIIELHPDNGYEIGQLKYDSKFIITSKDITIQNIEINLNDGNGFQTFGKRNSSLQYNRTINYSKAIARVSYELNGQYFTEDIKFYITTKSEESKETRGREDDDDPWDEIWRNVNPIPFNGLKFRVGIKYGCGNNGKIRRPIIISPPYRPLIQPFSMKKYWNQFNVGGLFDKYVSLGYDIIFVRQNFGFLSLQKTGTELAQFIKNINNLKKINYPDEDWENILMGYSMGGQNARYALLKLEKEHMEAGGDHHHTRLYVPFDSPHHGANIPLFAQATYKTFSNTNIVAGIAYSSLIDPASTDMGLYSINSYTDLPGTNIFRKERIPHPDSNAIDYQNEIASDFHHHYSNTGDTRKTFPAFTRNVAVSTGSYKDDYNDKWNLYPGKLLFSQNAPGITPYGVGVVNRDIKASHYSTSSPSRIFRRRDFYIAVFIPLYIRKEYHMQNAYEWDLAQGGYKTLFYDGLAGGATTILRLGAFGFGTKYYKDETSFLPLVSSLAINPTEWENNNIKYNLQTNDLFIAGLTPSGSNIVTNNYGYPNLGHPSDHFNITPFEAVYADIHSWDHIVMKKTVDEYGDVTSSDFNPLVNFLVNEVEADEVALQNKVIGENHILSPDYRYKAWYKGWKKVSFGSNITYKTDPGDYIIKKTGDITSFSGGAVTLEPGFSVEAGGTFLAYIDQTHRDNSAWYNCNNYDGPRDTGQISNNIDDYLEDFNSISETEGSNKSTENKLVVFPNPNKGKFTLRVDKTIDKGRLEVFSLDGRLVFSQKISKIQTNVVAYLKPGLYEVIYYPDDENNKVETTKLVIY
ncbi:Por secretion system C-terminal sorting domain-containing protein [Tenacibaculum sp. MAR_2009_124]|uniref:T9SS type A sorting domain-containing protein n=1 Tax=Tenacibaculum sp. MAR_2009_124 TaxID=1250059 RepID=UPI000898453E|nr:T9SS type A sorting domain-containing protein [Tenacibaculum sp. MAR_2009_124]SEB41316.1 Por secretion system C-terminal sorting domain-containing protein [Tenacibaculum sp. MAR_2009_124]